MKVDVYFNLHNGKLSVKSRDKATYGRVFMHTDKLILTNCTFIVQPAGRARVLREKRKNVHAFVRGELLPNPPETLDNGVEATYNPYRQGTFVERMTGKPILKADVVRISGKRVTAYML